MATIRPFRAVRPSRGLAERIAAPAYDVVRDEDLRQITDGNPYSFLHITRSEADFSEGSDPYSPEVYKKSGENAESFIEKGYMSEDDRDMYYIYRMTMNGKSTTGIAATASIDEYADGTIKKHEVILREKLTDRISHFYECGFDTEPVLLTYRSDGTIEKLAGIYAGENKPEYSFEKGGVFHELWPVADENMVKKMTDYFHNVPCLYIADGHHRSASAYEVGERKRKENPGYSGDENFNYFMATVFPGNELTIMPYNRAVRDLAGLAPDEFLEKVKEAGFTVEKADGPFDPAEKYEIGMGVRGSWYRLRAGESLRSDDIVRNLDVSILQDNLLDPVLGIKDPSDDDRIDFFGGGIDAASLAEKTAGSFDIVFTMYPVGIEEIMGVADIGGIMPPKSTWVVPKPLSGLFMYRL